MQSGQGFAFGKTLVTRHLARLRFTQSRLILNQPSQDAKAGLIYKKSHRVRGAAAPRKRPNPFLRRRVRRKKHFSVCKCGICSPMAKKLCARQTAIFIKKSRAFFDIYIHMAKGRSRPPSTLCSRGRCSQSARVTCRDFSIMPSMSSSSVSMAGAPYSRVPHSKCSWKLR